MKKNLLVGGLCLILFILVKTPAEWVFSNTPMLSNHHLRGGVFSGEAWDPNKGERLTWTLKPLSLLTTLPRGTATYEKSNANASIRFAINPWAGKLKVFEVSVDAELNSFLNSLNMANAHLHLKGGEFQWNSMVPKKIIPKNANAIINLDQLELFKKPLGDFKLTIKTQDENIQAILRNDPNNLLETNIGFYLTPEGALTIEPTILPSLDNVVSMLNNLGISSDNAKPIHIDLSSWLAE